jgi:hypothetical protein|tara:strand:+ start:6176 stop:6787 length:612 start_codon:yes stop_codon:yes gene_type:complete
LSELKLSYSGYVCAPYLHSHESISLKESWMKSKNIESLFFVTGTFSTESKPYFEDATNHYLLAKFKDSEKISKDFLTHNQEKTSFEFDIQDELFQKFITGETKFVSVYYMEEPDDSEGLYEIADLLLKRNLIGKAGFGMMRTYCLNAPKFSFPYSENIIIIEVNSEKSHQSVKKYCDQTRRDVNRKGLKMTGLMSLSILEQLK